VVPPVAAPGGDAGPSPARIAAASAGVHSGAQSARAQPEPARPEPAQPEPAEPAPTESTPAEPTPVDPDGPRPYQFAILAAAGDPEAFAAPAADSTIRAQVARVIATEAPITFDLLARRIADAWQIARVTERVRQRIRRFLPMSTAAADVILAPDTTTAAFRGFRTTAAEDLARSAEDLPVCEIANAMAWLLRQHVSIGDEDLARETARLFGIARLGSAVRGAMTAGLDELVARGDAMRDEARVRLAAPGT
jgi:hypothetical protein